MESEQIKEKVKDVKTLNRAQRRSLERRPHSSIFHKKFETKTKLLLAKVEYVSKNSGQTGLKEFKSELISNRKKYGKNIDLTKVISLISSKIKKEPIKII